MALRQIRRCALSTVTANLSFCFTNTLIPLDKLDSAESLLVKLQPILKELYVINGMTYHSFRRIAIKSICAVGISIKNMIQAVNKIAVAYSRVYYVLKDHRDLVIEAFSRKSRFDIEAALNLLERCELRRYRGGDVEAPEYPSDSMYDILAQCANDFSVFTHSISGTDLIDFRDGTLLKTLYASNMARAVFFLSLLEKYRFFPKSWKATAIKNRLLVNARTNVAPSINYLYTSDVRNSVEQYLDDVSFSKNFSRESFYIKIARAVKEAVRLNNS